MPSVNDCALYNFILVHEGLQKDECFRDNTPTKLGRGWQAGDGGATATATRERSATYVADTSLLETWGEEGSGRNRARATLECRRETVEEN